MRLTELYPLFKSAIISVINLKSPVAYSFKGGLGSQIMDYILFENLSQANPNLLIDSSYFTSGINQRNDSRLSQWKWELGEYGISLDSNAAKKKFTKKISLANISKTEIQRAFSPENLINILPNFPISEATVNMVNAMNLPNSYGAIHVRQGDYLSVSKRIINLNEVLKFAERIYSLLPESIVMCTDSKFLDEEFFLFKKYLPNKNIILTDPLEKPQIVHAIMRKSSVLITSNSTFSWTAGLLNVVQNSMVFTPNNFFGPDEGEINSVFKVPISWGLF